MQYVRSSLGSIAGSVSKTYSSINPATLSGAIDVIVVEQANGDYACSPFHVRFGKFSLLRPYEKKVEFRVNGGKTDFAMKLGEGGEAFFIFETSSNIPADLQTSPLVSPEASPRPMTPVSDGKEGLQEVDYLSLEEVQSKSDSEVGSMPIHRRAQSDSGDPLPYSNSLEEEESRRPSSGDWSQFQLGRSTSDDVLPTTGRIMDIQARLRQAAAAAAADGELRSQSPPMNHAAVFARAQTLSRKLSISNIPSHVTDNGDVMLDMHGYKMEEEDDKHAEVIARKILAEELEGNYDIGSLMGVDGNGNLCIYASQEAKELADRKGAAMSLNSVLPVSDTSDAESGYSSDDARSVNTGGVQQLATPPTTPPPPGTKASAGDPNRNYAKTLRLTSNQLKSLDLHSGANTVSFTVNRATCTANMYLWKWNVPIVISDIDGTITKSDALGQMFTMIGRDWTHLGVAKLYTDIARNGYNMIYLTSRGVGQADTTRNYLKGIVQDTYKIPPGPVIMSPDRTLAALRREVYLRKPEVFKMACLRDIMNLFGEHLNPFYAGFGNRLTDALSYRSVNIPSTRIYTINSDGKVILDLLTLTSYKSSYVNMRDDVDHFFPPVNSLTGDESYTDFNYWREPVPDPAEFSDSDDEDDDRRHKFRNMYQDDDDADEEDEVDDEEQLDQDQDQDEDAQSDAELEDYDDGEGEHLGDSFLSANQEPHESTIESENAKFDSALDKEGAASEFSRKGKKVEDLLSADKASRAAGTLKSIWKEGTSVAGEENYADGGVGETQGVSMADPRLLEAHDDMQLREQDERDGKLRDVAKVLEGVVGYTSEHGKLVDRAEEDAFL